MIDIEDLIDENIDLCEIVEHPARVSWWKIVFLFWLFT